MVDLLMLQDVKLAREGRVVLGVEHLNVLEGERLVVVGPNGSGKSTLLLSLARLLRPVGGKVLWRGLNVEKISPVTYRRRIGLVLQEALLLDASVYDNVAAGLRFRRVPEREIRRRVAIWLDRLGVGGLAQRQARTLSGGEAQRVSLARALVLEPELLLLDEPFGALDPPTRLRLQEDFQHLMQEMSLTMVFVTHDLNEALLIGQRMAVLAGGQLAQVGSPQDVFSAPVSTEVAALVGIETVLPGRVEESLHGLVLVRCGDKVLEAVGEMAVGRDVYVCLRPEDVTLWPAEMMAPSSSARNWLTGQVLRLSPQGALMRVTLAGEVTLVALVTRASAEALDLKPGCWVKASFKASAAHIVAH